MIFRMAGTTIQGGREYQEDFWLASDPSIRKLWGGEQFTDQNTEDTESLIILLADGVGGGGNGDIASQTIVVRMLSKLLSQQRNATTVQSWFLDAVEYANSSLMQLKAGNHKYGNMMGTTLIVAHMISEKLHFSCVGDSSIFRIRDNEIHLVNDHHEQGLELDVAVSKGTKTWARAADDRHRKAITSAITGDLIDEIQYAERPVQPGDIYLFASDGIEILPLQLIRRIVDLHRPAGPKKIASALVQMVDNHGISFQNNRHDNTTVVVVECVG